MAGMTRELTFAVILAAACVGSVPAQATPFTINGTVNSLCQIGTSKTYNVSIAVVATGPNMGTTVSLDGTAGSTQSSNNATASVTKNYTTLCNRSTAQTLTLTAPRAISGGNNIIYTIKVQNAAAGGGTTVATATTSATAGATASVSIPASTNATWSIVISATNRNSQAGGTYTASVTIQ